MEQVVAVRGVWFGGDDIFGGHPRDNQLAVTERMHGPGAPQRGLFRFSTATHDTEQHAVAQPGQPGGWGDGDAQQPPEGARQPPQIGVHATSTSPLTAAHCGAGGIRTREGGAPADVDSGAKIAPTGHCAAGEIDHVAPAPYGRQASRSVPAKDTAFANNRHYRELSNTRPRRPEATAVPLRPGVVRR
jgi:hypothetical protein